MKSHKITFITCLFVCLGCLPQHSFADAPIEDGVYYISNLTTEGYLGLGAYHNVDPYIYYVTDGEDITDDGWWIVTNTRSGYTFRNQATNQLLVFTYDRVDQYYKYMNLADESLGDHSEYWNIIEGDDGAFCIQSALDTDYYWNLRSGTNMMGTYKGGWGNGWNERYQFHEAGGGSDPDQGEHAYVDLGLPSGTLWATCNVGASSPEEYGNYFAWGETKPKKSNGTWGDYSWGTYKWMNQGKADWTQINKYTFADNQTEACWYDSNGTFIGDGQTVLLPEDDAATANWGSEWQMPSMEQMKELIDSENTTSTWTTMNGVNGRLITSIRNNASIFLPAGGRRNGTEAQWEGSYGFYWPNMTDKTYTDRACMFTFNANSVSVVGSFDRYAGESIRPVRVEKKTENQFPADQYTPFAFPKALHVYLSDGRMEAYPLKYITNYGEKDGKLVIETNIYWTFTYNLSEVDSVSEKTPDFPTFESYKFNNKFNDQLFTDANGEMVEDTVFVTIACIGKRLTPSFKVPDDAEDVVVYAGGNLQTSKETRLRFDKDIYYLVSKKGYTILTPDADNKYFQLPYGRCVRVHVDWLTDRAEVPTIYINTEDGQPITSKDYFKNATISIDGHGIFPSMEETAMQIKGRGNSSWGWPKKPYRMKFAEKVKPLGMTKGKNWVLLSNYQTGSLMSNAVGMKAANLMEAAAANHIVPVDLYLNGEYRGSYNLTEKVGFSNNSVDLDDETAAALLELDSYYDEPDGQKFRSIPYNLPINIKEPEFAEGTTSLTLEMIRNDFNAFMATLKKEQDISRFVDIEQLARFLMVNELICNFELYHPKSTFCYKESFENDTSKYVFGPVWDLDWGFGYEQNRSYFKGNKTSNYWTEMPNMEVIQFIQDLRWNYEPLCDIYKQLWKKFLDEDLQELLEYCQDYYDFACNSFESNKGKWGDNTDYAQQVKDAASWLETRANKIYQDILDDVRPYKPDPVDPIEFANDKLYTISCRRGDLILSWDYNGLEAGQSAWWTVADYEKQFAIINIEGNNYLYSPHLKKYLRTGYVSNGEWVEALGSPIYFDTSYPNGEYLYMMSTLTDFGTTLWFNNNTSTIVINTYNTPDDGDRWKITEAGDFDPTEALEIAQNSMLAITMNLMFDDEIIASETKKMPYGADMPEPPSDWSNAFVMVKPIGTHPYMVMEETTVAYEAVWTGPFDFTTSMEDAKWYNMTIRSDYMVGKTETEPYYPVVVHSVDTLALLTFQWAFSGNPYRVKVYNRSTGLDEVLTLDGSPDQNQVNTVMRTGDYSWTIRPNSDGFVLSPHNHLDVCINQFGGSKGALQTWKSNNSPRDNGSTFRVTEAPDPDGVVPLFAEKEDGPIYIYNVAGQRLDNSQFTNHNSQLPRGIYIVNGRKIFKK